MCVCVCVFVAARRRAERRAAGGGRAPHRGLRRHRCYHARQRAQLQAEGVTTHHCLLLVLLKVLDANNRKPAVEQRLNSNTSYLYASYF